MKTAPSSSAGARSAPAIPVADAQAVGLFTPDDQPVLQYRVVTSTNLLGWKFSLEYPDYRKGDHINMMVSDKGTILSYGRMAGQEH